MGLGLRTRCIDLLDSLTRRVSHVDSAPHSLRAHVGCVQDFERVPSEFIAYFKLLCGLEMDQSVLDVGCGAGRFASQLVSAPNGFSGTYRGFDIHRKSIEWATRHVAAAHPNCRFDHADLRNSNYNPGGALDAVDYRFPYDDDAFDFVFAISVFTHLRPETTTHYLAEIRRVLRDAGTALLTFLLLDGHPEMLTTTARNEWWALLRHVCPSGRWSHHGDYSVVSDETPEAIVAYQESAVRRMLDEAGLNIESIRPGRWNERSKCLSFQDIVVVS